MSPVHGSGKKTVNSAARSMSSVNCRSCTRVLFKMKPLNLCLLLLRRINLRRKIQPCSIIGATRSYWGNKEGDFIYAEFQQAYKRNHSRRRVGKMTPNEFYEWSEEARKKRGECEAGLLSIDEYRVWLGNKK